MPFSAWAIRKYVRNAIDTSVLNISIARFYICIRSSAHYNYSRNWREADRGRLWAYKWRFKQPLLVHTSLMICLRPKCLTHPVNFPCVRKHGVPGENPRLSAERWLFTLSTWGLGSSHIEKFSLRFEPVTSEVKGKCANHFATEALSSLKNIKISRGGAPIFFYNLRWLYGMQWLINAIKIYYNLQILHFS
jgi:hypothetical protein